MALTRKFLSALGIEAEKIDEIITAHTEVTDALKHERDQYKADAERLPGVQAELDSLKKAAEGQDGKNPFEVKYKAIKEEFEAYKADVEAKATKASKETAYRALLVKAGIQDKRIDAILRVSDVDGVELDKDGNIKGAEELLTAIKTDWADFIPSTRINGVQTSTPPTNNGGALKTKEEIYKKDDSGRYVLDASQRQAALAQLMKG